MRGSHLKCFAAAEMADLRGVVVGVREALKGLSGSVPSDQIAVMQMNAREKRIPLARGIRQLSPSILTVQVQVISDCHITSGYMLACSLIMILLDVEQCCWDMG